MAGRSAALRGQPVRSSQLYGQSQAEGVRFPPRNVSEPYPPGKSPCVHGLVWADGGIRLEAWDTFAEISGSAAAALTGLLFVAVSIRITYIARSQELRNRAAQTLSLFGTVLIISVLIAIPRQAYRTLGAELVVLAVIAGMASTSWIDARRARGVIRRSGPYSRRLLLSRSLRCCCWLQAPSWSSECPRDSTSWSGRYS